jgi:hypothetical protein
LGTVKKKTYGYVERDEQKRKIFKEKISNIDPTKIVYLDESGINDDEVYPYGWAQKCSRLYGMKKGSKSKRLSMIGGLCQNKILAALVFEGSCTRSVFEVYIEQVLIPKLKPGSVIVLDNAAFHHGGNIKKLIEDAQCELLYLPAYSPDLNPIEHWWALIKNKIKRILNLNSCDLYDATVMTLGSL